MCGKGSNTQTSNQTTTPNATAMEAYRDLLGRAQTVADTAYNPATQQQVAGFTAPQTQAFGAVNANLGAYQPYMTSAAQYGAMGAAPVTTTVANYMNPYTDAVVDATQRDFAVQNARQQSGVVGNARMAGSLGGDREAVAQALTSEAQNRTQAPIIANLRSQGYSTALGAAQADASRQLAASQQFANLGGLAQQYGYGDINALLQSGALQQGQQQRVLDAASANAAAESAYPFQTTQWLAGLEGTIGPAMGSTSRGTQTGPSPNTWSQALGGGLALMSMLARGGRAEPRAGFAGGGAPGASSGANTLAGFPYTSAGYVPQIPLTGGQALQMMGQSQSPSRSGTTGGDALSSYRSTMDMFGAVNRAGNGLSQGLGNLASWGLTTSTPDGLGGAWSTSVTPSGFGGWGNFLSSLATGGRVGYADGGDVVDYTDAVSPASAFFMGAGGLPLDDGGANAGTFAAANRPQAALADWTVLPGMAREVADESVRGRPTVPPPPRPALSDLPPVSDVAVADRAPAGVAYVPPGMTTGSVPAVAASAPAGGAPATGAATTLADAPGQKSESWWSGFTKGLDTVMGKKGSPERQAWLATGLAMMAGKAGGPGSFGINMGNAGLAGLESYRGSQELELKRQTAQRQADLAMAQEARLKAQAERLLRQANPVLALADRRQALIAAGVDPNSEQGRRYLLQGDLGSAHQTQFGKNPIWGTDDKGNPVIVQLNDAGQATKTVLPEGVRIGKDPVKMDAGTHFVLMDPVTRQTIGVVPKDVAGKEAAEEVGKARGKAVVDLPRQVDNATAMLGTIDKIFAHPALPQAVGVGGILPAIPGTEQADAVALIQQLNGKAFLEAFNSLRGGGQITEVEGEKATDAIARLRRTQSVAGFQSALRDLQSVVRVGLSRARSQAGLASGMRDNPVPVNNPQEAATLPPGTFFVTPDNQMRQRD